MPEDLKSLVKNPLGIIALFIALIYGCATLSLGMTAANLTSDERQIIIWFIVIFPVVVLFVFYLLVTKHHVKLYSPRDFKNDDSFLKTLSVKQQEKRLDDDIMSLESVDLIKSELKKPQNEEVFFSRSGKGKTEEISTVVNELEISRHTVRNKYKRAEKLAILKIEKSDGLSFEEQVSFGNKGAIAFDGVSIRQDTVVALEVKYLYKSTIPPSAIREIMYRGMLASAHLPPGMDFKLIIALVLDNVIDTAGVLEGNLKSMISDSAISPLNVDLRIYTFVDLSNEFSNEAMSIR